MVLGFSTSALAKIHLSKRKKERKAWRKAKDTLERLKCDSSITQAQDICAHESRNACASETVKLVAAITRCAQNKSKKRKRGSDVWADRKRRFPLNSQGQAHSQAPMHSKSTSLMLSWIGGLVGVFELALRCWEGEPGER